MKRIFLIGLSCLAAACSGALTELVVVVDSDLAVPGELDAVEVRVSGVESMSASGAITNAEPLPRTVGVVHRGGGLGPVEVTVIGSRGGAEVIRARAVTWFVRGQTLVLPIFLSQECTGVTCPAGRTCDGGACVSASVDPATLAVWSGTVPRLDGGDPSTDGGPPRDAGPRTDSGPVCVPSAEQCNGEDDDCDGDVDEGFDLDTDPLNCGGCDDACTLAGATAGCAGGLCTIESCDTDRGDCNGDARDGCEANLATSALHCGACDDACDPANGSGTCVDGACELDGCDPGFEDCNGDASDGCETALSTLTDCGACGVACEATDGTPTCASGTCAIETCDDPAFGDCNTDATDGCETALNTLTDCGSCGSVCNISGRPETCATGTCLVECSAGRGDCDGSRGNGCETNTLTSDSHCGMCGNACDPGDDCTGGVCL